jgi:hypothetical protein
VEFICNELADLTQFDEGNSITNPSNETIDLTPAERSYLNSIDVLRPSNSFGYEIYVEAVLALHWAPNG